MNECCATCKLNLRLERLDYQRGGCVHEWQPGYICLAFQNEGIACWMIGQDPKTGMCECYTPKEGNEE